MTCQQIQAQANNPAALKVLFSTAKLLTGIFYSLNYVDLPEFFEDNINPFMTGFKMLLTFDTKHQELLGEVDNTCLITYYQDDSNPGLLHSVQAAILKNINLYVEKYEEEFSSCISPFVQDSLNLLMKTPADAKYDAIVCTLQTVRFSLIHR